MLTAEAVISTENAERYAARLCGHAGKMGHRMLGQHRPGGHGGDRPMPEVLLAVWSGTEGAVTMDWGRWTVRAAPDALTLRAEAADAGSLRRIQDMLAARLEKFGRREHLTVTWQPASPSGTEHSR